MKILAWKWKHGWYDDVKISAFPRFFNLYSLSLSLRTYTWQIINHTFAKSNSLMTHFDCNIFFKMVFFSFIVVDVTNKRWFHWCLLFAHSFFIIIKISHNKLIEAFGFSLSPLKVPKDAIEISFNWKSHEMSALHWFIGFF